PSPTYTTHTTVRPDRHQEPESQHGADVDVSDDATRAVGVHDDNRPIALTHLPGHCLCSHPRGGGRPEALLRRRPLRRASGNWKVSDSEGIEVDVLNTRVRDTSQVLGDSRFRPNGDEEHLRAGTVTADPNLAEPAVIQQPARSVGTDVEPRAG